MKGIGSNKEEIFGKFKRGGISSKIKFIDYLLENNRIRIDNGQNSLFVYLLFIIRALKNFKRIFNDFKNK